MAFDFKKEYKEFYMPKNKPEIVIVPKANYIAVKGKGDPNEEGGAYQQADNGDPVERGLIGVIHASYMILPPEAFKRGNDIFKEADNFMVSLVTHFQGVCNSV